MTVLTVHAFVGYLYTRMGYYRKGAAIIALLESLSSWPIGEQVWSFGSRGPGLTPLKNKEQAWTVIFWC